MSQRDDLAEIAPDGTVQPRGESALLRLQSRSGAYRILPSPNELLLFKRAGEAPDRPCLVCGEVPGTGSLCDVLSFVGHTGWKGEFVVHDGVSFRSLFFEEGHVVGAQSTVVRERLGEVLYRYGALDREQVTACSEAVAAGPLRFGEVAVKLGYLTRETLFELMNRQPEEIFYGLLLATGGTYFFLEGFDDADLSSRHKLSLTTLLRDGIRRMHEMRYFRARIPSELHVPVATGVSFSPAPEVAAVHALVDGKRTVADIARATGTGEFEVTRALFHLVQTGHVEVKRPRLTTPEMVEVYNSAIALLLRELDAMDEGDSIREQLATFAAKPPYAALFAQAGPADDGTLDGARIALNLVGPEAPPDAASRFAGWLHDYASYALFLARPHLRRNAGPISSSAKPGVSTRVKELLHTIAPTTERSRTPTSPGET